MDRAVSGKAPGPRRAAKAPRRGPSTLAPRRLPPVAVLALAAALCAAAGCAVDQRRSGLPTGAQAALDAMTEDVAAGRFDRVYEESAKEWRDTVSAEENARALARVRERLGRVQSRAPVRASEQGADGADGHALTVTYNTKFERGDAVEFVTLVEREGRWRLARYSVNSEALR